MPTFEKVMLPIVALCAVTMTAVTVYLQFFSSPEAVARYETKPEKVSDWSTLKDGRLAAGASAPEHTIVEFADFQCPYCKQFHAEVITPLLATNPQRVRLVFRHYPIPSHANAMRAAFAAECATPRTPFDRVQNRLYTLIDTLQRISDISLGKELGISDTLSFQACLASPTTAATVTADTILARRTGVRGTPTLVINGMRYARPPALAEIQAMLK